MKGIGGPLLCIGDLLSDLGESDGADPLHHHETPLSSSSSSISSPIDTPQAQELDLTKLFQLCSALENANKLVQSTNSNVRLLSEKVGELEKIVKRGDSAIASAKAIHVCLNQKQGPFGGSENTR